VSIVEFTSTLNEYGSSRIPFLFFVDFEMEKPQVYRLEDVSADKILYSINGRANFIAPAADFPFVDLKKIPPGFQDYKNKFDQVWAHLVYGDSYLTNLTIKTEVDTSLSLRDLFFYSKAKYKVWFEDRFLVFSPETFVRIGDGSIFSFPMKGTIDASFPDAMKKILADPKETAEHVTIVDLIRNDLSSVAENVEVTRFRFVEEIRTMQKNLLQVSSEIRGDLPPGYQNRLGDILLKLLPAGSVSGAPKCKTLSIIRDAEKEPRGYYTGVVGLFDGKDLDSGVMIRFLESDNGTLYYRSGGGITVQSAVESEYQEAIDKVYVPLD
jgi:para-aminobenzoate synthetase component I